MFNYINLVNDAGQCCVLMWLKYNWWLVASVHVQLLTLEQSLELINESEWMIRCRCTCLIIDLWARLDLLTYWYWVITITCHQLDMINQINQSWPSITRSWSSMITSHMLPDWLMETTATVDVNQHVDEKKSGVSPQVLPAGCTRSERWFEQLMDPTGIGNADVASYRRTPTSQAPRGPPRRRKIHEPRPMAMAGCTARTPHRLT